MTLHYSLIIGFINKANITEFTNYIKHNADNIGNYDNIINYKEYTDIIMDDLIYPFGPQIYSYEQLHDLLKNSINDKKYNLCAIYSILLNNYT
jgi:hypothetical protein